MPSDIFNHMQAFLQMIWFNLRLLHLFFSLLMIRVKQQKVPFARPVLARSNISLKISLTFLKRCRSITCTRELTMIIFVIISFIPPRIRAFAWKALLAREKDSLTSISPWEHFKRSKLSQGLDRSQLGLIRALIHYNSMLHCFLSFFFLYIGLGSSGTFWIVLS
jgi:hypothetical protein